MSKNQQQHRLDASNINSKTKVDIMTPMEIQEQETLETDTKLIQQETIEQTQQSDIKEIKDSETLTEPIIDPKPVQYYSSQSTTKDLFSSTSKQEGFKPVYDIELELTSYAEAMDKKNAIVPEVGGKWQYSLFKTIKSAFAATTQEDFNNKFNTILSFFNKNKDGIFNEKFIFRFPENWPGSSNEYTQNRRLIYLIIQTADPKTRRAALNEINMEIVAEGLTEDQKQKLFNFYML